MATTATIKGEDIVVTMSRTEALLVLSLLDEAKDEAKSYPPVVRHALRAQLLARQHQCICYEMGATEPRQRHALCPVDHA
jgi:hypothetical protein